MGSLSPRGSESRPDSRSPIVFVVDDDVSVRESLEALIRCAGWIPETFASAQSFLARSKPDVPSCLVLDVSLPGLSGLDLQNRVAADLLIQQAPDHKRHNLPFAGCQ